MQKGTPPNDPVLHELCLNFSGPMLFQYVWWILKTAQEKNIKRLYFLARDGYLLLKIAEKFCQKFSLQIECRYLYCSRTSLRMPSYHLIGEEAFDLLLLSGYRMTLRSLLERGGLDGPERSEIYQDCGLVELDENRLLCVQELKALRPILKGSGVFRKLVTEKSKTAYSNTIGYLKQEGLLDFGEIALVDSGWTGSMQRSLRQLLQSSGHTTQITGFYFGMYAPPKSQEDGVYLAWYFNHGSSPKIKIPFCNNLFECLLSAPHGMTNSYQLYDGSYVPEQFSPPRGAQLALIQENIRLVLKYTQDQLEGLDFSTFCLDDGLRDTSERIFRYMAHPTRAEAACYGRFLFCDDTTESYHLSLADESQLHALKGYTIPSRVARRLFLKGGETVPELYWPYGTIAFLPHWRQWWYRLNIYVWEWLRYTLR